MSEKKNRVKTVEDADGVRHRDGEESYVTNDALVKAVDDKIEAVKSEYSRRMSNLVRNREQVTTAVEMEHLRAEVARLSGGASAGAASAGPTQPPATAKPVDGVA